MMSAAVMPLGPVMLDIGGPRLTPMEKERLRRPAVGGVILFSRNYQSPSQLLELTTEIRALRNPHLLIAVDHEGGRVQRFRDGFTRLPAMRELGKIWDVNAQRAKHLAQMTGFVLAAELRACGVDLSFTPVLDVDHGASSIIGDRALHSDLRAITELARSLMQGLKQSGMAAVGKHFPGHGFVTADSHLEVPVDERSLQELESADLLPFIQMIGYGLSAIMSAHVIYSKIDKVPATFSSIWLREILRHRFRFEGVIFSDDLGMEGASSAGGIVHRAHAAINAGCDMVLVCSNGSAAVDELLDELRFEMPPISMARLAQLHGRPHAASLLQLREDAYYAKAVHQVASVGLRSGDLALSNSGNIGSDESP
ncbi:MAG TPA: beta-N-acetylhexosaminidase [Burkholderiales bacterium]|nr:beta-N-acetylhexosaminidase [Burkholderiales bacterium]